jgi:HlyD family secretion protein
MAQPAKSKSRAWLWILLAVIAVAVIYLVTRGHTTVPVRAARVSHQDLTFLVSTNGKVEPVEDFQAHASSAGVVDKLFVHLGEQVRRGQQLLLMDATDAASKVAAAEASLQASSSALLNMQHGGTQAQRLTQQADLASAQSEVKQAATSLSSLQALQAQGAASANEVALAQQHLTTAQSRVAQIEQQEHHSYAPSDLSAQHAQVAESRSALTAAESGYSGVDVRAPFPGTVYALPVAQYDFVQAGEALLNMADLTRLRIRAYFDEPEIGKLAAGQPVKIDWPARPNQVWHGHVEQAPTTVITYGTRNVGECLITVDDARGDLLPNTNVTVTVTTAQHNNVLSVPREALHTEGAINFVYRIVDDRLVRTPVEISPGAIVNLTRAEISSGLKDGDLIALGATTEVDLSNGLKVKVVQ